MGLRSKTIQQVVMSLIQDSTKLHHILQIHSLIIKASLHQNNFVLSKFLRRLFLCSNDLSYPRSVFDAIQSPDTFIWNTMIRAYLNSQNPHQSLSHFIHMRHQRGISADSFSLSLVLQACGRSIDYLNGRAIHTQVLRLGFCSDLFVQTALIEMYAKFGCIDIPSKIFDGMRNQDVVSCNVMLVEYIRVGKVRSARELFDNMSERDLVSWNTMIHGYASVGQFGTKTLFCTCGEGVLSSNSMIVTHSKMGKSFNEALRLFHEMKLVNVVPDEVTMVSVLLACGDMGDLGKGKMVHGFIERTLIEIDLKLGTALVDMYAKCGDIDNSLRAFDLIKEKDVFAWSAVIVGLANHGLGELALGHFSRMIFEQIKPNDVTFMGVLSACSRVGLVDEGLRYIKSMNDVHGISPKLEHYGCIVDILGRAGQLQEARKLISSMPFGPDAIIWRAFLGACVIYKNVELAEDATVNLLELEPHVNGNYVLSSNIFSQAEKWDKVTNIRKTMKITNIKISPGNSSIEVDHAVHEFVASDTSHPQSEKIYRVLAEMNDGMKHAEYQQMTPLFFGSYDERERQGMN